MRCDWCQAEAKYEVNESKAWGRHLTAAVEYHSHMPPRECRVEKIEQSAANEGK